MADNFDAVFHGDSESECIDFICAVRQHAKDNGKIRDNAWIADELYNAFRGKALKWYICLPVDIRGDWERLQQALAARWTTGDEVDDIRPSNSSLAILPTAAAAPAAPPLNLAPSIASFKSIEKPKVGRLRIRASGIAENRYVSKNVVKPGAWCPGAFHATTDAVLALRVRLITTTSNFYRLELIEHESQLSVLAALHCYSDAWNDINCWIILVGVDAPGQGSLRGHRTTFTGYDTWKDRQFWTERWQLEDTGVLNLCSPGDAADTARFVLGVSGSAQDFLWFVGPKVSFGSNAVMADLEFEPLDN